MLAELTKAVTIAQAARRSGVHVNTVRRWIDAGRVEVIRTPYGRAIEPESLERWERQRAADEKAIASR